MLSYHDIVPKKGLLNKVSANVSRERWSLRTPSKSRLNNTHFNTEFYAVFLHGHMKYLSLQLHIICIQLITIRYIFLLQLFVKNVLLSTHAKGIDTFEVKI